MKGIRFSLRSMFLGIAAVCLACAALVKPNWVWVLTLQAASLGVLTLALLAALIYQRGAARTFWIGFAVVGWGYLGLQRLHLSEVSISGEVSEWLLDVIHPYPPPSASPPPLDPMTGQARVERLDPYGEAPDLATVADLDVGDPESPQPAAHDAEAARNAFPYLVIWIWPPLFGFVGGVVAQQLYFRRERLAAKPSPSGSGPM
jgi:hypothetical protein